MSNADVIRFWKDEHYRLGLSESQRASLPDNPAGVIDLPESELVAIAGGTPPTECGQCTTYLPRGICGFTTDYGTFAGGCGGFNFTEPGYAGCGTGSECTASGGCPTGAWCP